MNLSPESSCETECDHDWIAVGFCPMAFGTVEIRECRECEATNLVATSEEDVSES
jgi:hypothetical protein